MEADMRGDAYPADAVVLRRRAIIRENFMVRSPRFARWLWPALAVLAACVPFAGGFSLTKIFYIRDLTMFFWPRHLWIQPLADGRRLSTVGSLRGGGPGVVQ